MKAIPASLIFLISFSSCTTIQSKSERYSRSEWNHWIDEDGNCFNTRHEILKARSESPANINVKGKVCYVQSGLWSDYYFPEKLTSSRNIDIDHLVPLKHAYDAGGKLWSPELKEKFANDPDNLVITNKKYNRQKGAKKINEWLPLNIAYACKYYKDWMKIKVKYNLPISDEERSAVDVRKCPNDPLVIH